MAHTCRDVHVAGVGLEKRWAPYTGSSHHLHHVLTFKSAGEPARLAVDSIHTGLYVVQRWTGMLELIM